MASVPISSTLTPITPSIPPSLAPIQLINLQGNGTKDSQAAYKSCFKHISALCKDGQLQEAVDLVTEMEHHNFQIGPEIYGEILQGCVYGRDLRLGQQIHAKIIRNGDFFAKNEYVETKLVIFYAKCDLFDVSSNLFCRLRRKNVFSWAAVIGLYCRVSLNDMALRGFIEMKESGILGDNFVIPNVLKACSGLNFVGFGKCVHGYALKLGFEGCVFVASSLVDMYGKCGALSDARKVFDGIIQKNTVAWNSMIVSYVQNGLNEEAIEVFLDMRREGIEPSRVTLSNFLSASANLCALKEGKQGHAIAIVNGLELDNILGSSVINFYAKVGLVNDAELVFSRMIDKDVVTWNLLMSCYVQCGLVDDALNLCHSMRSEGFRFDSVTLSTILTAAADLRELKLGQESHSYCIKNKFETDLVVASSIANMYAKCERIIDARLVFDSINEKDLVLWNTILAAYAELGLSGETLKLFYQMQLEGVPPNVASWNSVILGFLRNGQVDQAKDIFSEMLALGLKCNVVTYTTLISGLSQNGLVSEAIMVFLQMLEAGIHPSLVSIVAAISSCTGSSLLGYGKSLHGYIIRKCLPLSGPVATSLLDMYAKCGNLKQAKYVFDLASEKDQPLYNAMLSAYAVHGYALDALSLFKQMQRVGIEPDGITFTSVLTACCHAGLVAEGLEIFADMVSSYNLKPSMEHYGCVVVLLAKRGNLNDAVQLMQTMPFEPDAYMFSSLLTACRNLNESELGERIAKLLLREEPDNPGNFVSLSNAYASSGRWDEVSKLRDLMKVKGVRKTPGCSWIQIGSELHVFGAGDQSHLHGEEIDAMLVLLATEMQAFGCFPTLMDDHILCP